MAGGGLHEFGIDPLAGKTVGGASGYVVGQLTLEHESKCVIKFLKRKMWHRPIRACHDRGGAPMTIAAMIGPPTAAAGDVQEPPFGSRLWYQTAHGSRRRHCRERLCSGASRRLAKAS